MVYEQCLAERNSTLINLFGPNKIPIHLPPNGSLLNVTNGNGSLANLIMPELPECDLEKELDNVSTFIFNLVMSIITFYSIKFTSNRCRLFYLFPQNYYIVENAFYRQNGIC